MTRAVVTCAHRYKRPPRENAKAATLTGPAAIARAELPPAGKVKAKAAGERRPSDGQQAAVATAKPSAHDRRNRAIVKRLAAGASPRTVGAVFGLTAKRICQIRVQVTGVRRRPAYASWPANRVARLRLLWRRGLSTAEIGRLLGVSKSAVVGKIDRLELPPPSAELQARKRRRAGRPPFWSANSIAKLRKLLGTKSYAVIGRKLGVSTAAVYRQAHRLGLLPPRKQPALAGPAVVTKRAGKPKAEPTRRDGQPSVGRSAEPATITAPPPANDDGKPAPKTSAIVTVRRPGKRDVPDLEEHQRRGDTADAMFREIVRRSTGKER